MKNLTKILMLFAFLSFFSMNSLKAQTNQVHIKDLILMPDDDNHGNDTINKYYKLVVKVDKASLGNRIFILLGTSVNQGNILSTQGYFQSNGTNYAINYNSVSYPISKYSIVLPVSFPKSYLPSLQYLTVYVEQSNGILSNKLHYSFNP